MCQIRMERKNKHDDDDDAPCGILQWSVNDVISSSLKQYVTVEVFCWGMIQEKPTTWAKRSIYDVIICWEERAS